LWEAPETSFGCPETLNEHTEGDFKRSGVERPSLQPAGRTATERLPHQESEVERARVDEEPFEDVLVPS